MLRREFLKTLAAGIATALAPIASEAWVENYGPRPVPDLIQFRCRNRFDAAGRTVRTIQFIVRYDGKLTPEEIAAFLGQQPDLLPPPRGIPG